MAEFDWEKAEAEAQKPKMIPGVWKIRVSKIVDGKKDGSLFTSSKGDPQIMVVFADEAGRECGRMYTLSSKAIGFFAVLLKRCAVNLKELGLKGIQPHDFSDMQIANQYLLGKELWGRVTLSDSDRLEIEPMTEQEAQYLPKGAAPPPPPKKPAVYTNPGAPTEAPATMSDPDLPF